MNGFRFGSIRLTIGGLVLLVASVIMSAPVPAAASFSDQGPDGAAGSAVARSSLTSVEIDDESSEEGATFGAIADTDVPITMTDGVVLVGDVMYPAEPNSERRAEGTFPVLLTQTPYSCGSATSNSGFQNAAFFAERGYILASVCVRGSGRSDGEFTLFGEREQRDGVDLVRWAAGRLDGSNGKVGLIGCSYLGLNQIFTQGRLGSDSPVKAMIPQCAGGEFYRETYFSGGMPTQTANFLRNLGTIVDPRADGFGAAAARDVQAGGDMAYFRNFWQTRTPANYAERIAESGVPMLLWTSWDDIYTESAQSLYASLQNAYFGRDIHAPMSPGQPTTDRFQIIIEPGGHGAGLDRQIELEWMDTWLKDKETRFSHADETPMHLFQQGAGTWINTASYPMVPRYTPYYLGANGELTTARRGGGRDSVAFGQPDDEDGSLVYTSEPLKSGATLAGPVSATIYASSTSNNLNLIATLEGVAPDGTVTEISSGSLVGSLRALDSSRTWRDVRGVATKPYGTFSEDVYLRPRRTYRLDIALSPDVRRVDPGTSLRLVLTTQTPPNECARGLGTDPCFATDPQLESLPGTYSIHRGSIAPSAINIPLLPHRCFTPSGGAGVQPGSFTGPGTARRDSPCEYHQ